MYTVAKFSLTEEHAEIEGIIPADLNNNYV
jgi:hypothetical protein